MLRKKRRGRIKEEREDKSIGKDDFNYFCTEIFILYEFIPVQSILVSYISNLMLAFNLVLTFCISFLLFHPGRYIAGTPVPNQLCSFAMYSDQRREGEFMSPTYPGVYPKDINCYYLFKGVKGQRVKLEFMDFDLFSGGPQ